MYYSEAVIRGCFTLFKKWTFPGMITLVNVTTSPVNCVFGHIVRIWSYCAVLLKKLL